MARATAAGLTAAGGLAVLAVAFGIAGLERSEHPLGTNNVRPLVFTDEVPAGERLCQDQETVWEGTKGIWLRAGTSGRPTPALTVRLETPGVAPITGRLARGWQEGDIIVPVAEVRDERADTRLCVTNHGPAPVALAGEPFGPELNARVGSTPVNGRVRVEYRSGEQRSWWAHAGTLVTNVGRVRAAWPGGATLPLAIVLIVAVAVAAVVLTLRPGRRTGLLVALVATLNALAWGFIIPPLHVPDETAHTFYAQHLGETGKLPQGGPSIDWYSDDETRALARTYFYFVIGWPANRPPADAATRATIARDADAGLDRVGAGNASTASNNPPLFYVPYAAVYRATHPLGFFDRLAAMRVLSALLAGLTVLCVFGFLREVLPGSRLAATVGALTVGLLPQFAFINSGVNNDVGLYLAASMLLLALARMLRRGLTARRAAWVGLAFGAGVLVKTQMLAFAPAVALAFLLALRQAETRLRPVAIGAAAAAAPLALYGLLGATIWNRPLFDRVGEVAATPAVVGARPPTVREQLSYLWQEYLPRLPFMEDMIAGFAPWQIWFRGLVGRFGWLDYGFPNWVYFAALVLAVGIAGAAGVFLWRRRAAVRARAGEATVYLLGASGLLLVIAIVSYRSWVSVGGQFEQARYLLPLLALFALVPALAVRAAGRWARVAGVALVLLAVGLSVFAQALTLERYYG